MIESISSDLLSAVLSGAAKPIADAAQTTLIRRYRKLLGRDFNFYEKVTSASGQRHRGKRISTLSVLDALPVGMTDREVRSFLKTPESTTLLRQMLAVSVLEDATLTEELRKSLETLMLDMFPLVDRREITAYAIALANEASKSTDLVASEMRTTLERQLGRKGLSDPTAALMSLCAWASQTIDEYRESLVKGWSADRERRWTEAYASVFTTMNDVITLPDLRTRRTVPIRDLHITPDLRYGTDGEGPLLSGDTTENLVILGAPGAGKSTHARTLALTALASSRIPFLLPCKSLHITSDGFSLVHEIQSCLENRYQCTADPDLVRRFLIEGRAVVILDGLDEILSAGTRGSLIGGVEAAAMRYPFSQFIVTSRSIGYSATAAREDLFDTATIKDFDIVRVKNYVTNWFRLSEDLRPAELRAVVDEFMSTSEAVNDLRKSPLLLAFICLLYRGHRAIPRRRSELLRKCADLLLGEWDVARGVTEDLTDLDRAKLALGRIAFLSLTEIDYTLGMPGPTVAQEITQFLVDTEGLNLSDARRAAESLVHHCRDRGWMFTDVVSADGMESDEVFDFTHASFREYFAALYINRQYEDPTEVVALIQPQLAVGSWEILCGVVLSLRHANSVTQVPRIVRGLLSTPIGQSTREGDDLVEPIIEFLAEATDYLNLPLNELHEIAARSIEVLAHRKTPTFTTLLDPKHRNPEGIREGIESRLLEWGSIDLIDASPREIQRVAIVLTFNHLLRQDVPTCHWFPASAGPKGVSIPLRAWQEAIFGEVGLRTGITHWPDSTLATIGVMARPEFASLIPANEILGLLMAPLRIGTRSPNSLAEWVGLCMTEEPRHAFHNPAAVSILRTLGAKSMDRGSGVFASNLGAVASTDPPSPEQLIARSAGYGPEAFLGAVVLLAGFAEFDYNDSLTPEALSGMVNNDDTAARRFLERWQSGDKLWSIDVGVS